MGRNKSVYYKETPLESLRRTGYNFREIVEPGTSSIELEFTENGIDPDCLKADFEEHLVEALSLVNLEKLALGIEIKVEDHRLKIRKIPDYFEGEMENFLSLYRAELLKEIICG